MTSNVRFMENNFAELITASVVYSSELASFPGSNVINSFRSRTWKPSGQFEITASNKEIYIDDGTPKTVSLTVASYATPALMAAHIETQLNASSSNWSCSYDSAGGTYKFTISNTGSVTLALSTTTNAVWDTLGYTGAVDLIGTSFEAGEQRNHSAEHVTFDLGYNAVMQFFSVIGPLDEIFSISDAATIRIMASNLNQWSAPPLDVSLTRENGGILHFFSSTLNTGYRFWRFEIVDKYNPLGPEGLSFGHIYLGDYLTLSSRNMSAGFKEEIVDPSDINESDAGALFFNERTKYSEFNDSNVRFMSRADKDLIKAMFQKLGRTTPFYFSIDPETGISDNIDEFTKYVVFKKEPRYTHIKNDIFSVAMSFREAV